MKWERIWSIDSKEEKAMASTPENFESEEAMAMALTNTSEALPCEPWEGWLMKQQSTFNSEFVFACG